MHTKKLFVLQLVLACFIYQNGAFSQTSTSQVSWSSFNMGFAIPTSATTRVCAAIGQPFVGATQNTSTQVVSGFLVHPFISGIKTAVEDKTPNESPLPTSYELKQNYPNPFNPSTTVQFALPKPSAVTLKIIDMLGREIATLVDEKLPAGEHKVVFDTRNLPSGIYYYRLQAEEFSETRKLMLVR